MNHASKAKRRLPFETARWAEGFVRVSAVVGSVVVGASAVGETQRP